MATKKISFELDVDGKPIDVIIDKTLNLKQQFRELTKEINRTQEGTKEFELLSTKIGDVKDQMQTTTAKSRDLFGSLSLLPGPVGMFANSVDGAIGSLKLFSSFNLKDLKFQLGETLNDFKDIATNIGKATGITKVYTVLNGALANSFKAVGVAEGIAATGAKALSAALTATGVGALVVAIGYLVGKMMEWASSTEEADTANESLNRTLKLQNDLIAKNAKDIDNFSKQDVLRAKIAGKTEEEIYKIQTKANRDLLENRRNANNIAFEEIKKFDKKEGDYAKLTEDQRKEKQKELIENEKKTYDAITDQITSNATFELEFQAAQADKARTKKQQETDKKLAANKQYQEKLAADTKTATDLLLDLQQENSVLVLKNERDRQDQELKNQKKDEEDKINTLKLKDTKINGVVVTAEELRNNLLEQVTQKYDNKKNNYTTKRNEEDVKSEKEMLDKLEDIRINGISNLQEKEKAELQKGYNDTKAELDKALEDKKISQEQYNTAILNLNATLAAGIKKIDDDKTQEDKDKRVKDLDDQLRFLQIKGEALREGTKAYWDNQLAILNAAQEKELADTTLTEEAKTAIEEKYAKLREDLRKNEARQKAQQVGQIIGELGNITDALASSYDEEAKTSKTAFEKRKKLQKSSAIMGGASAIINVLAAPPVGNVILDGILKGLQIGFVALKTGQQIRKIDETTFEGGGSSSTPNPNSVQSLGKGYAEGGLLEGPRHAQGGMMINAEGGEAVMTRGAVTMFAPMLSMMNQMGGGTSFSKGASGQANFDQPKSTQNDGGSNTTIMKTYVVSSEMTSDQEKQARLKDLSTL
jgi:hypothetical protein